jgi:hypothetical protein
VPANFQPTEIASGAWVASYLLSAIALQYNARLHELRANGAIITKRLHELRANGAIITNRREYHGEKVLSLVSTRTTVANPKG